jgi:hypothetical protein
MAGNLELIEGIIGNEAYQHPFRPHNQIEEVGDRKRGKTYRDIPRSQKATLERRRNRRQSVITQIFRSMRSYSVHATMDQFNSLKRHLFYRRRAIEHNATDADGTCTEHRIQIRPFTTIIGVHDDTSNAIAGKERPEPFPAL